MKAVIDIKKQNWTGWAEEQPEAEFFSVELEKGDLIEPIKWLESSKINVQIEEINDEKVVISALGVVLRNENGGINLLGGRQNQKIELEKNVPVKLSTPSTDMGVNFSLTLKEIKA